ncbi:MAG: carbamoyltransferase HypF [Thermoplasmatota archaeon]
MWEIVVRGVVQGVGFRPSVKRAALDLSAKGYVRNDGSHVSIITDVEPEKFIKSIRSHLGPMGFIEEYKAREGRWTDFGFGEEGPISFTIEESTEGDLDSSLPPDTAICGRCLSEMIDPDNRRYLHPFTNCTDCGARYTVIRSLPYDRIRTAMDDFPPCEKCTGEYGDHTFRRFHAQTLSCPVDGPVCEYLDDRLRPISSGEKAFDDLARSIQSGRTVIVKGWGGMHIVCDPSRMERMREWYGRPYKPFALMCRDVETAGSMARITESGSGALLSPARPIVLLEKLETDHPRIGRIQDLASPGLDTIGIYLPYSGIHHLIFRSLDRIGSDIKTLLMTSANPPGDPMAVTLEEAYKLGADGYFVHNRKIEARCDDSVVVPDDLTGPDIIRSRAPFSIRGFPIRKARGLIPDPLDIPHLRTVLALGAERNVSVSAARNGRVFTSPYVGNSRHPSVLDFMRESSDRIMNLFGAREIEAVVIDRHPRYASRRIGIEYSESGGIPLMEMFHHHAHAASLLVDSGTDSLGCVVVDGVGFGSDSLPWGGEALFSTAGEFQRAGHLRYFGLPGGDASVFHPERIAHWLSRESGYDLDLCDDGLADVLVKTHGSAVMTSSLGRLLDALSALLLGVTWRSYDGEPAMRMEPVLRRSKRPRIDIFREDIRNGSVDVANRWGILLSEVFGERGDIRLSPDIEPSRMSDLAMGMVAAVVDDLVILAGESAAANGALSDDGKPLVGISGGVAYNIPIVKAFLISCRNFGARPVLHSRVPPGDGGISVGQAAFGGLSIV